VSDIDRGIPFIETHHHLWELDRFPYGWLREPGLPGHNEGIGDYKMLRQDWGPRRLFREFYGQNVIKSVHVEGDSSAPDPVAETAWLEAVANEFGMPNAIVAYADLEQDGAEAVLDRHLAASDRVRGIRIRSHPADADTPTFQRNVAALGARGLSYELNASPGQLLSGRALAAAHPDVQVILGHTGNPIQRDAEYFDRWRREISTLAEVPTVAAKISGLGMSDHAWTIDSIRPWVLHTIDAFGTDRAMFGTNWPVDVLFAPYMEQVDAYRTIIAEAGFTRAEQAAMLHGNAERFYRI
jgi:predicted TIM-barrel fold metal-dependent hydrolase